MKYRINENLIKLKQSDIRRMTIECNKIKNGINLSQGICDLDLPDKLVKAVPAAIKQGYNIYTRYDGIIELRKLISKKMRDFNKVDYNEEEIVVTCGSTGAFFLSVFLLLKKNDEVILFQPYYGYHYNTLCACGIKPVIVDMNYDVSKKKWFINFEELKKKINKKTKAIVINTPANPSGKIFTEIEILEIGKIAKKNNLLLITDEIYEYITFNKKKHISPAAISDFKDITITIGGFSKTFSITGWRIGYLCAPKEISEKIGIINDLFYVCAPAPLQKAVSEAMKINKKYFTNLSNFYQQNRDLIIETLEKIGFIVYYPEGAYYLLADFTKLGYKDCYDAAFTILKETGVAAVPGAAFFKDKTGYKLLRFCFAKKYPILKEACKRLLKLKR